MEDAENKFFHIFTVDFLIDNYLNAWIIKLNSDPNFTKENSIFDEPKQAMLEEVLKNVSLKIVKNLDFHDNVVKEQHRNKMRSITASIKRETKAKDKFKKSIKQASKYF
jgi:hypothetical protein